MTLIIELILRLFFLKRYLDKKNANQSPSPATSNSKSVLAPQEITKTYATFADRLSANTIDYLVLSVVGSPIYFIFNFIYDSKNQYSNSLILALGFSFVLSLILVFFYTVLPTIKTGGTIGKRILGLSVVDINGNKINLGKALLREYIARPLSAVTLGYLWIISDEKRQATHDKIAGTFVIKNNYEPYPSAQPQSSHEDNNNSTLDVFIFLVSGSIISAVVTGLLTFGLALFIGILGYKKWPLISIIALALTFVSIALLPLLTNLGHKSIIARKLIAFGLLSVLLSWFLVFLFLALENL